MRIGEVIGRVTCSQLHPSLKNPTLLVVAPMPREAIVEGSSRRSEAIVVLDELGAGRGAIIGISEGREAANPFGKVRTPIDAYCACLIDQIHV